VHFVGLCCLISFGCILYFVGIELFCNVCVGGFCSVSVSWYCAFFESLRLPWLRFFRAFSTVVRQMPGYNSQRLVTANSSKFVICVALLLIVLFYLLFVCKCVLPPGVNPIAVDKYIDINCITFHGAKSIRKYLMKLKRSSQGVDGEVNTTTV
jgi:hypothetical protein